MKGIKKVYHALTGPRWPQLWGQEHQARLHQEGVLHPLPPAAGHRGHDRLLRVPAPPAVPEPDMSGGQCHVFTVILQKKSHCTFLG